MQMADPVVYMSYTSQNFCLFHLSNLSVLNYRICLLMYAGVTVDGADTALRERRLSQSAVNGSVVWTGGAVAGRPAGRVQ